MAFHRIKKYSRQVIYQDCVLSCQPNQIEEIPSLSRAKVSGLSLRDQRAGSSTLRSIWSEKDLHLSGMLMCWHLWNSRSVPRANTKKRAEVQRRNAAESRERVCHSLLTLRDHILHMAVEKYLLFLMPRDLRKEQILTVSTIKSLSRRDRFSLSTLYIHTALGLQQYKLLLQSTPTSMKEKRVDSRVLSLSPERISFPSLGGGLSSLPLPLVSDVVARNNRKHLLASKIQSTVAHVQRCTLQTPQRGHSPFTQNKMLSLHCPSVLSSPDIQDIAQSGLLTLEGSLTLDLS